MVGTATDFARFAQMLLNGGQLDGRRYLKPETISLMTSDLVPPESESRAITIISRAMTALAWALPFGSRQARRCRRGNTRWDGAGGTFFFVDPKDDMFAVCMLQTPSQRQRIQDELKALIYQALEI